MPRSGMRWRTKGRSEARPLGAWPARAPGVVIYKRAILQTGTRLKVWQLLKSASLPGRPSLAARGQP